jgi:hypothetical protein
MGKKDAIIDPKFVRIEATPGTWADPEKFVWNPPGDPLETAGAGIALHAHVERAGVQSLIGDRTIAPVYDCQKERVFAAPQPGQAGENGAAGPPLEVAVTSLSTPWFANAALIRIQSGTERIYVISSSADRPVHIITRGQDGARGAQGPVGTKGADGAAGTAVCGVGVDGLGGGPGGPGAKGGDGGPGGKVRLMLEDAKADALRGRVIMQSGAPRQGAGARCSLRSGATRISSRGLAVPTRAPWRSGRRRPSRFEHTR